MTYSSTILADSPILYWRLGEASGTAADNAEGTTALDGTYLNTPTLGIAGALTGDADTAVTFNGTDESVRADNTTGLPAGSAARSVEAWFKSTDTGTYKPIVGYGSPVSNQTFKVMLHSGAIGISTGGTDLFYGSGFNDGNWHHVVAVAESATSTRVYVDNTDLGAQTHPTLNTVLNTTDKLSVAYFSGIWLACSVDEVAVYGAALSAGQVAAHYAAASASPSAYEDEVTADSPQAWWHLGEASGSVLDATGHGNTGTVNGTVTRDAADIVTGVGDGSIDFLGTGDITVGDSAWLDNGDVYSWEFWFNLDTLAAYTTFMSKGIAAGDISIGVNNSTSKVEVFHHPSSHLAKSTASISTGVDYHLVFTKNGSTRKVYLNGTDVTDLTGCSDVTTPNNASTLYLGNYTSGGERVDGRLDEIAVYATALSAARVAAHYAAKDGTPSAVPVWTTPADTDPMSTTPELKFDSPVAAVAQHFYLELDTANTFNTGNLRTYRSDMNQTNWAYYDGDSWEALPSTGLPSGMSGNEIRYTVTDALTETTWYRRVRAGT